MAAERVVVVRPGEGHRARERRVPRPELRHVAVQPSRSSTIPSRADTGTSPRTGTPSEDDAFYLLEGELVFTAGRRPRGRRGTGGRSCSCRRVSSTRSRTAATRSPRSLSQRPRARRLRHQARVGRGRPSRSAGTRAATTGSHTRRTGIRGGMGYVAPCPPPPAREGPCSTRATPEPAQRGRRSPARHGSRRRTSAASSGAPSARRRTSTSSRAGSSAPPRSCASPTVRSPGSVPTVGLGASARSPRLHAAPTASRRPPIARPDPPAVARAGARPACCSPTRRPQCSMFREDGRAAAP